MGKAGQTQNTAAALCTVLMAAYLISVSTVDIKLDGALVGH
jgi:hypothetical protein